MDNRSPTIKARDFLNTIDDRNATISKAAAAINTLAHLLWDDQIAPGYNFDDNQKEGLQLAILELGRSIGGAVEDLGHAHDNLREYFGCLEVKA